MITLDRIKYFIEAANLEHVGKAALKLNISPSVVSSAILSLEEEFNTKFFERQNNRLKLNEKGHQFLEKAKGLLESAEALYSDVAGEGSEIKGHFKLGGSHFLLNQYLVPAFIELQKSNHSMTAEFQSLDTGAAVARSLLGELDGALVFRSQFNHDLEEFILSKGSFVIAVKKGHPILKTPMKKRAEALNALPAISFKTTTGPAFPENHPVFRTHGINPKHTYFYSDDQSALMLLQKTQGWALLPEIIVDSYSSKLAKVQVDKDWNAPVFVSFIRNKNKVSSRMTSKLKDLIL